MLGTEGTRRRRRQEQHAADSVGVTSDCARVTAAAAVAAIASQSAFAPARARARPSLTHLKCELRRYCLSQEIFTYEFRHCLRGFLILFISFESRITYRLSIPLKRKILFCSSFLAIGQHGRYSGSPLARASFETTGNFKALHTTGIDSLCIYFLILKLTCNPRIYRDSFGAGFALPVSL